MDISYYWKSKDERAKIAVAHTADMDKRFADKIKKSKDNSQIYGPEPVGELPTARYTGTQVSLKNCGTGDAVFACVDGKTAALNFASYLNPGGCFIGGSRAQEESMCHESFLYNVLVQFPEYYKWNSLDKNRGLYKNRAIYSPEILWVRENEVKACDVITCAAPNLSWALKTGNLETVKDNHTYLKDRIKFVLDIAAAQKVDTLILGAYGCGVFSQDATEVATDFLEFLSTTHKGQFKNIVFAIPQDVHGGNYDKFKNVLEKEIDLTIRI